MTQNHLRRWKESGELCLILSNPTHNAKCKNMTNTSYLEIDTN